MFRMLDANPYIGVLIFFSVVIGIAAIVLAIVLPITLTRKKYKNFVLEHSLAIRNLKEINKHYSFKKIPKYYMKFSYDNRDIFADVTTKDYLTYQLVEKQNEVNQYLKDALYNKERYDIYVKEVKSKCRKGTYDVEPLHNTKLLERYEYRYYNSCICKPVTSFSIFVILRLVNQDGDFIKAKRDTFEPKEIKDIIFKINQKRNGYYLIEDIWKTIAKVERSKVTNKMRFAIYRRDHHRCCMCGIQSNHLEIDHKIPISKGGKSTYDNLQSLCHECNVKKGASLDY